jgi:hypothetical protein
MAKNPRYVYQIKVTLKGVKPPVWRRLLVSGNTDLSLLHRIIQVAMGWTNSHMHQFVVGLESFGVPHPEFEDEMQSENGVRIGSLLTAEKDSMTYEYDFGDGWEHKIVLEKILPHKPGESIPTCTGGRRACPPEDVGGVYGYADFLKVYGDANHPEHDEMVEWAGESFDPERFDAAEVNRILSRK